MKIVSEAEFAERLRAGTTPLVLVAFEEPPRVAFWYEAGNAIVGV